MMELKSTVTEADSTSLLSPQSSPTQLFTTTTPPPLSILSLSSASVSSKPSSTLPPSPTNTSTPSSPIPLQPSPLYTSSSNSSSCPASPQPANTAPGNVYVASPPSHNPLVFLPSQLHPANLTSVSPSEMDLTIQASYKRYDPLASEDWDRAGPPGTFCAGRVKKDLNSIFHEPLPLIVVAPEEDNLFLVHCLVTGPFDTPYEGGFFHFLVRFGPQYPLHPPRVRLMTTGGGTVRFNPNLYKNGKVCLSILGTWTGPAWSPASNLASVLLSLQSLMSDKPYFNEPGFQEERKIGDSARYNTIIQHETIRVAVIQQLELAMLQAGQSRTRGALPPELLRVMESSFLEYYDHYIDICHKNLSNDGQFMEDPFGENRGRFQFGVLQKQLRILRNKIKALGISPLPEVPATTEGEEYVSSTSESEDGSQTGSGCSEVEN